MTFTIRPLTGADLPAVGQIADATDLFPSALLAGMTAPALTGASPEFWLVAETTDGVAGFAYCAPERMTEGTWNLLALATWPDRQGRGIGSALIAATEERLRTSDARLLLIETADLPDFAGQRDFYTARGYERIAHIPDYYAAGTGKVAFRKALR